VRAAEGDRNRIIMTSYSRVGNTLTGPVFWQTRVRSWGGRWIDWLPLEQFNSYVRGQSVNMVINAIGICASGRTILSMTTMALATGWNLLCGTLINRAIDQVQLTTKLYYAIQDMSSAGTLMELAGPLMRGLCLGSMLYYHNKRKAEFGKINQISEYPDLIFEDETEEEMLKEMKKPQNVRIYEREKVAMRNDGELAEALIEEFGLEENMSSPGAEVTRYCWLPATQFYYRGETLWILPKYRCVLEERGGLQLVDKMGVHNRKVENWVGLGFTYNVWGLVDNRTWTQAKSKTELSVPSGFNSVQELHVCGGREWPSIWALTCIDQRRRENRLQNPDMPIEDSRYIEGAIRRSERFGYCWMEWMGFRRSMENELSCAMEKS